MWEGKRVVNVSYWTERLMGKHDWEGKVSFLCYVRPFFSQGWVECRRCALLLVAAFAGELKTVEKLLKEKGDVNFVELERGVTPLCCAADLRGCGFFYW